ncbi:hypothetical protein GZH46_00885 [Fragariocoptes setiger]|uniref:Nuclear respiratory factor 1 NLS/DNA-binding dimerisation domain-containing protein n=1 Tax=Fragariocoptes setiger TaxID=1670756 RepID=A0ABQ7SAX8_9ACAR|nr:hypothetical protein GZH46_00885 [Fragariocoptes setiger]
MSSDELSDDPNLDSDGDEGSNADLMSYVDQNEAIANLAATGLYTSPVGIAAGMAIASGSKKRKRNHTFETNPSVRKRQQTRLLRRLKATIDEYTTRVGQQAVVLVVTPQKSQNNYKVFGAKPLENVVRQCKQVIMNELDNCLAQQAPPQVKCDTTKHELPPLVVDGIPTPVEKMTQAQLRAFIPLMLKYSTGRGKPGWGKESTRPPWWPENLPWANVRSDARTEDDKVKVGNVSWTHALRQIVTNCYEYHGRQDLLPASNDDDDKKPSSTHKEKMIYSDQNLTHYAPTVVQTITNPDGSISLANTDGTVSLVQLDPSMNVITLPDGTQAQAVFILDAPPSSGNQQM